MKVMMQKEEERKKKACLELARAYLGNPRTETELASMESFSALGSIVLLSRTVQHHSTCSCSLRTTVKTSFLIICYNVVCAGF